MHAANLLRRIALLSSTPTGGLPDGGISPPNAIFSLNSIIGNDINNPLSQVFTYSGGLAGHVNASLTAAIGANAGGAGVHSFNAGGATGVYRSQYFVVKPGSTSVTCSILAKNYTAETGHNIIVSILTTDRGVEASTNTSPIHVTAKAHGLLTGDSVTISGHLNDNLTSSAANGTWTITRIDANTISLDGSTGNGTGQTSGKCASAGHVRATTTYALTGSLAAATVTLSTPDIGEYEFRVADDSGSRAFVSTQNVSCAGATGLFAADFYCWDLQGATSWWSNLDSFTGYVNYWTYTTNRGASTSTFASLYMYTNASQIVVETGSLTYSQFNQIWSGFDLYQSSQDSAYSNHPNTCGIASEDIAVTLAGSLQTVRLFVPGRNFQAGGWSGTQHRYVYFPASAMMTIFPATSEPQVTPIVISPADSISDGFNALPQTPRAWPRIVQTTTGRTLYDDANGGNTIYTYGGGTYPGELASKIGSKSPKTVIWAIGTNDFQQENGTTQSLATIMTYAGQEIDAILALPTVQELIMLLPWNKTIREPPYATGQGHTLEDWRNALTKLARDRGNPVKVRVYETTSWTYYNNFVNDDYMGLNGSPNDNTHPNANGQAKMAAKVIVALRDTHAAISPVGPSTSVGGTVTFSVSGGTGPYTYSIPTNVTGGSINATSGIYTAGPTPGTDVIKAVDAHSQVTTTEATAS